MLLLLLAGCQGDGGGRALSGETPAAPAEAVWIEPGDAALRRAVETLAAAGRTGDRAACRAALSQRSRALFDGLFVAAGGDANTGWGRLCQAHAAIVWPPAGRVERNGDRATLRVEAEDGGPLTIPFLHEGGAWRVDYAALPASAALAQQAALLEDFAKERLHRTEGAGGKR